MVDEGGDYSLYEHRVQMNLFKTIHYFRQRLKKKARFIQA